MQKRILKTTVKKMLADIHTPVGIYLRVRDHFRDTILLESTDFHVAENSYSFICINAIGGIEIKWKDNIEWKFPNEQPEKLTLQHASEVPDLCWKYMQHFEVEPCGEKEVKFAQGLYGYSAYDAVQLFDSINLPAKQKDVSGQNETEIPLMRYRLYQYVIAINHFKDELYLCENILQGIDSEHGKVEHLIKDKDVPEFYFALKGEESKNMSDEFYVEMVKKGIASCMRGDVFQIVLSRRYQQQFTGDEFNVYRALRNVNPSPYLFFFDYGDYKLMGSSPESQVIINNGKAIVHPIAGTCKRTGNEEVDEAETKRLLLDEKENAEHVMLVDLARNDLSRLCSDVRVDYFKQLHYYSHVIHLVSEVTGKVAAGTNPFLMLAKTFPAGTLSGAPKYKAMELIDGFEPTARSYYGGALGFMGFDGCCNHAIMIRTFLSKNNTLTYQAGGGIVAASNPENEFQEVVNKLGALKMALRKAETIS